jgi:Tol biopolymer transport system component
MLSEGELMKTVRMNLMIILLLVGLTSCSFPSLTTPDGEVNVDNEIATAVAATNIASSGQAAQPPASVNSLLVVYTDGEENLRAWSPEGGIRQLTTQGNIQYIVISPDGTQVAFVRAQDYRDYSIWVIGVDGANERQLVTPDDFSGMMVAEDALGAAPVQLEWVPGTNMLAFNTYPYFEGPGFFPHDDLWLVDAGTGTLMPFLDIGTGGMFAYSPNGSRLAVSTFQSVSLMDANGGNRRDDVLIYEPVMTYSEFLYYVTPLWSPDGSFLRAIVPPGDPLAEPSPPTAIWHIPGDGSAASQIASLDIAFLAVARLSPDLNRIMYITPMTTTMPSLHIANVDGSQDTIYHSDVRTLESWSPDGDRFVFTAGQTNQTLVGRVGENPAPLTEFETVMKILWIDPQYFLFVNPSDAGFELYLAQLNGQSVVLDTLQSDQEFWIPVIDVYP